MKINQNGFFGADNIRFEWVLRKFYCHNFSNLKIFAKLGIYPNNEYTISDNLNGFSDSSRLPIQVNKPSSGERSDLCYLNDRHQQRIQLKLRFEF